MMFASGHRHVTEDSVQITIVVPAKTVADALRRLPETLDAFVLEAVKLPACGPEAGGGLPAYLTALSGGIGPGKGA